MSIIPSHYFPGPFGIPQPLFQHRVSSKKGAQHSHFKPITMSRLKHEHLTNRHKHKIQEMYMKFL